MGPEEGEEGGEREGERNWILPSHCQKALVKYTGNSTKKGGWRRRPAPGNLGDTGKCGMAPSVLCRSFNIVEYYLHIHKAVILNVFKMM